MSETRLIALSEAENPSAINIFQIGGAIKKTLSWIWFGCHHPPAQKEISWKLTIYSDITIIQRSPITEEMSGKAFTHDASIPLTITH